jgi:phosphoglycolate phosphatase/pyrophosphatase PpaX
MILTLSLGDHTRYRCLVIDHDDTAVDSTASVHYPAHVRGMELLRPGQAPVDLDTWFCRNFDPGIMHFLTEEIGFTPEEMAVEYDIWREFTTTRIPHFFPGFLDTLAAFKARGGHVAVASHSETDNILAHYRAAGNGSGALPDVVFGWELPAEQRKPAPYPVLESMRRFGVAAHEVLVVDDLRPGIEMARAAGVDAAAVGWAHDIPLIRDWMRRTCVAYFSTVAEFAEFVLA